MHLMEPVWDGYKLSSRPKQRLSRGDKLIENLSGLGNNQ